MTFIPAFLLVIGVWRVGGPGWGAAVCGSLILLSLFVWRKNGASGL